MNKYKGMSKEDIYNKINLKGEVFSFSKIGYLRSLEPKVSLMKDKTRESFYNVLGDIYKEKSLDDYFDNVNLSWDYKKRNMNDAVGKLVMASYYYYKAGNQEHIRLLERASDQVSWSDPYKYIGGFEYDINDETFLRDVYLRFAEKSFERKNLRKAENFYSELKDEELLKDFYTKSIELTLNGEAGPVTWEGRARDAVYYCEKLGDKQKMSEIGDRLVKTNLFDMAMYAFKVSGAGKKKIKDTLVKAGDHAIDVGKYGKAIDYYEKGSASKTKKNKAWELLGDLYMEHVWSYKDALECYEKAGAKKKATDAYRLVLLYKDDEPYYGRYYEG
ncbi:MAG: hypothetical protein ABIB43_01780 [archaeon]